MFERNDRYLGLLSIICGILSYFAASKWKVLMAADPLGPSGGPKILGICFVILGIILTGGSLLSHNTEERKETPKREFTFIILLSVICFIYLNLLNSNSEIIGYILEYYFVLWKTYKSKEK